MLDTFDAATIVTLTVAAVQFLKDFGLSGHWLKLASVLIGGACVTLAVAQPELWRATYAAAIGGTASGWISLGKELADRTRRQ